MVELLNKNYNGESHIGMFSDVSEMFSDLPPDVAKAIPTDEHGFALGTFTVTVTWKAD